MPSRGSRTGDVSWYWSSALATRAGMSLQTSCSDVGEAAANPTRMGRAMMPEERMLVRECWVPVKMSEAYGYRRAI